MKKTALTAFLLILITRAFFSLSKASSDSYSEIAIGVLYGTLLDCLPLLPLLCISGLLCLIQKTRRMAPWIFLILTVLYTGIVEVALLINGFHRLVYNTNLSASIFSDLNYQMIRAMLSSELAFNVMVLVLALALTGIGLALVFRSNTSTIKPRYIGLSLLALACTVLVMGGKKNYAAGAQANPVAQRMRTGSTPSHALLPLAQAYQEYRNLLELAEVTSPLKQEKKIKVISKRNPTPPKALPLSSDFDKAEKQWLTEACLSSDHHQTLQPLDLKRVVVVVMESMGNELIHFYNKELPSYSTAAIDALLEKYPRFDNYWATRAPTIPGFAAMLFSSIHTQTRNPRHTMPPSLYSVLNSHGFTTIHLRGRDRAYGNQDIWYKPLFQMEKYICAEELEDTYGRAWHWGVNDKSIYKEALKILSEKREKPLFLLVETMDTHDPYLMTVPTEKLPQPLIEKRHHKRMVWYGADQLLGNFVDEIHKKELLDRHTLLVITGDHTYEGSGKMPLFFITHKDVVFPRFNSMQLGSQIDFAPTILSLLGLPSPAEFQGRSLISAECTKGIAVWNSREQLVLKTQDQLLSFARKSPPVQPDELSLAERALRKWAARTFMRPDLVIGWEQDTP